MSNSLAIATVTAALRHYVDRELKSLPVEVTGGTDFEVATARPTPAGVGLPKHGVNIYLYQITPNPAWRNRDLPTRRGDGSRTQRSEAAIDLHYLVSFFGDENKGEAQRLAGIVLRLLHATPVLARAAIRQFLASLDKDDPFAFLKISDLADAVELVRLTPTPLSLDEMSKVWSVFFQTSYTLSVAYQASVLLLDSDEPTAPAPPVRTRGVHAAPAASPFVDRVEVAEGPEVPLVATGALVVRGHALRGEITRVAVDGALDEPTVAREDRVELALPAGTRAGVHVLQVVHLLTLGSPPTARRVLESNAVPFLVHPTVGPATASHVVGTTTGGETLYQAEVTATAEPPIGRRQRVLLVLDGGASGAAGTLAFPAPARPESDPDESATVTVPVARVPAGTYLVRLQVDGAPGVPRPPPAPLPEVTFP
jgi:hypothetical protein